MSRSHLRTRVLAVRLTRGELATLRARADVAGVPTSTYVRERALAPRVRVHASRLRPAEVDRLLEPVLQVLRSALDRLHGRGLNRDWER